MIGKVIGVRPEVTLLAIKHIFVANLTVWVRFDGEVSIVGEHEPIPS